MLVDVTPLGPYFDVDRHDLGVAPVAPWRSLAELLDADVLAGRVAQVRAALAQGGQSSVDDVPLRVAASVMHLGLMARLLSPVLAEATLTGRAIPGSFADWWWQPQVGSAFPMSLPRGIDCAGDDADALAVLIGRAVCDGPVATLTETVSDQFGLSTRVLSGNLASALNAARCLIGATDPSAASRFDLIVVTARECRGLTHEDSPFGSNFRRHSCCLIYQLAPDSADAVCGDCVLRKPRDGEPG